MIPIEYILLGAGILLALSVIGSRASGRVGVPALVLFLVIGMVAGSEGPGGIAFDDPWVAQVLGVIALALILFAGGLDTSWEEVRPTLRDGMILATIGVVLTAGLLGAFVVYALGVPWLQGLLLGAIVSSTDAAAVFSVLRSRNVTLQGRLKPLLELESGSNDPMAVLLTVTLIRLATQPGGLSTPLLPILLQQVVLGLLMGVVAGRVMVWLVNRINLEYYGLYPVLTLSLVLLTYGGTTVIGGNGFLAVYLAGVLMGNRDFLHKNSLLHFHEGMAWLMQIGMFLVLGLLVFPSHLLPVAGIGLLTALFLMLVARPAVVYLTLAFSSLTRREKTMVGWVGLRGAVPIVLATYPLLAGIESADTIFNVVFFVVLTSVLIQGTSIPLVARWLRVDAPLHAPPPPTATDLSTTGMRGDLTEIRIPKDSPLAGKRVVEVGIPRGAYIVLILRGEDVVLPGGATQLKGDDLMLMAGKEEALRTMREMAAPHWGAKVD